MTDDAAVGVSNERVYSIDGLHPPLVLQFEGEGRKLLKLARTYENAVSSASSPTDSSVGTAATELLRALSVLKERVCRRGLILDGDEESARRILAGLGGGTNSNSGSGKGRKGKGRKGRSRNESNDLLRSIDNGVGYSEGPNATNLDSTSTGSGYTAVDDYGLVVAALVRILGGAQDMASPADLTTSSTMSVVSMAADTVTALTEHTKLVVLSESTIGAAQYQLVAGSGRMLLVGLIRNLKGCQKGRTDTNLATVCCFRGAASLVSLFGTKLSRNTAVVTSLRSLGWSYLSAKSEQVRFAAAVLLASIPNTAVGTNKTPSDLWNACFVDCVFSLSLLLEAFVPSKRRKDQSVNDQAARLISDEAKGTVGEWIDRVSNSSSSEARVGSFQNAVAGLTGLLITLLDRPFQTGGETTALRGLRIPFRETLDVFGRMLSFSSSAEGIYFSSKKRLRHETIDNGLATPFEVAHGVANEVTHCGHRLLQTLLQSTGRPAVLRSANQVWRIVSASFQTAVATVVKQTLDPSVVVRSTSKKRRWLHESIVLRTEALHTLTTALSVLGPSVFVRPLGNGNASTTFSRGNDIDKIITMVVGSLLQQLPSDGASSGGHLTKEWGSISERSDYT